MRQIAVQQAGKGIGIHVSVVHARNHHVLVADAPAGYARMGSGGGYDLRHGPAAVEWYQNVSERIARRVKADRERELRVDLRQPPDPRHDAGGRDDHVSGAEAEALRVG